MDLGLKASGGRQPRTPGEMEETAMRMVDIRKKAKDMGLRAGRQRKAELIRSIQAAEGNSPCFGTANDDCDQQHCCWREDCLPKA